MVAHAGGESGAGNTARSEVEHPDPDYKDWTWTLNRRCPQCGLAAGGVGVGEIADRAEAAAVEWVQILTSNPAVVVRPEPRVWSPLEYGAHVRDVYGLFDNRLALMLTESDPTFDAWDQDAAAVADDYAGADPDRVAEDLSNHADSLVRRVRSLDESQWARHGRRSDGTEFTVETYCQYLLHDVVHHLWDVTGQQDAAGSLTSAQPGGET